MHKCKSGKHTWTNKSDADKCCNGYVRILVLGSGDNRQECAGVSCGRAWMKSADSGQPSERGSDGSIVGFN